MMIFFNKIILSKILLGMKNQTKKLTKMQLIKILKNQEKLLHIAEDLIKIFLMNKIIHRTIKLLFQR